MDYASALRELFGKMEGFQFNYNFGGSAVTLVAYIFMALGLYTIARNRRINNPWLAWIPVANLWILGCISDQYHYVTKGQQRKRRKGMLTLSILQMVLAPLTVILTVIWGVSVFMVTKSGGSGATVASAVLPMIGLFLVVMVLLIALMVIAIILQVQRCCAYYDLFSSCVIQNKTLYSVLSIVASCLGIDLVAAILIFVCRDKEEGMPPRNIDS